MNNVRRLLVAFVVNNCLRLKAQLVLRHELDLRLRLRLGLKLRSRKS